MSAQPEDLEEVELSLEECASLVSRHGKDVTAYDAGGRRWAFKKPTRAQWQAYKCDQQSPSPTTKADAGVALARACVVPFDPAGTVAAEREAFDALGEDYPALLDLFASLVEASAIGPLPIRGVRLLPASTKGGATSTPPPKA